MKSAAHALPFAHVGLGRDRDYVIENLSLLVASGMGIMEALANIKSDVRSHRMQKILDGMSADIDAGSPLWRALEHAEIFPSNAVSLVRVGEESGRLTDNLRIISQQEQKNRLFRSRIRSAMMYPVFVLGLTVVIGIGIAWFILPKLAIVFSQLKLQLPLITKILISGGVFLGNYGTIVVPAFLLGVILILYLLFSNPVTKVAGQTLLFSLPGVRQLIMQIELSRFGYLLGTLLQAGLPVTQALASLADATDFPQYRRFYQYLIHSIDDGNSFQKSFEQYPKLQRLMPRHIQQLVITGEKSGKLSEILLSISKDYEEKSETTTKDLTVILEPILLVIVWLGVVAVAIAVILPIYSLVGGLNNEVSPPPPTPVEQTPVATAPSTSDATTTPAASPIIITDVPMATTTAP